MAGIFGKVIGFANGYKKLRKGTGRDDVSSEE